MVLEPSGLLMSAQVAQQQRWLEASRDIATTLLGGADVADVFPRLIVSVRDLAEADSAFLALPMPDGNMRIEVADGWGAADVLGLILPAQSMSAQIMGEEHSIMVADARQDRRIWQSLIQFADAGPAVFVPLGTNSSTVGTLIVTNRRNGPSFDEDTITVIEAIAAHAAIALRLGAAAKDREQLAVVSDRDRIARDLHDLVIQRLFATGISLQGLLPTIQPTAAAARVQLAVDDLDATIKEIRSTIFALHPPMLFTGQGLRSRIRDAVGSSSIALGFTPVLRLEGPIDLLVPSPIGEQLLAVLREALSNVAHHAQASASVVTVRTTAIDVILSVTDNGVGIDPTSRRSGLLNLAQRASHLGGRFDAEPATDGPGTLIEWSVPLNSP